MPTTIDGRAAMTSMQNLVTAAARPPISVSKTAIRMPSGAAIRVARAVISSVPTMALRMPPPVALRSPGGSWVKNSEADHAGSLGDDVEARPPAVRGR